MYLLTPSKTFAAVPNQEGKKASVAIYSHLYTKYGKLNKDAALEGIQLYDGGFGSRPG